MSIANVKISNFKSFEEVDLDLTDFNVLIGGNASGKSNFVNIFKFLRDIFTYDLNNAISMQGGLEYLINQNKGSSENLSFKLTSTDMHRFSIKKDDEYILTENLETVYSFSLKISDDMNDYKIVKDNLKLKCDFFKLSRPRWSECVIEERMYNKKPNLKKSEKISSGQINISKSDNNINLSVIDSPLDDEDILPEYIKRRILEDFIDPENSGTEKMLLIETPLSILPIRWGYNFINVSSYDFDPRLCKRAALITGKFNLEEDGNNLSIILKHILDNEEKRELFINLIKQVLPFFEDIKVANFIDKSVIFQLKEKYSEEYIAASFISDGTINIIALILALYFEESLYKNPLIIFEEPERNMHPKLISSIVDMINDASSEKQIIITTHNPEILKNVNLNQLLFISRNSKGFSQINKPEDNEEIKYFLKNKIGIEELFLKDLIH